MSNIKAEIVSLTNKDHTIIQYPNTVSTAVYDPETKKSVSNLLSETAISVNTISDLNKIPLSARGNRRLVRVGDVGNGKAEYYSWDPVNSVWELEKFTPKMETEDDIPVVIKNSLEWNNM